MDVEWDGELVNRPRRLWAYDSPTTKTRSSSCSFRVGALGLLSLDALGDQSLEHFEQGVNGRRGVLSASVAQFAAANGHKIAADNTGDMVRGLSGRQVSRFHHQAFPAYVCVCATVGLVAFVPFVARIVGARSAFRDGQILVAWLKVV